MTVTMHYYDHNTDYDFVRAFLLEIHLLTRSFQYLTPLRVENNKYGPCGTEYSKDDDKAFMIWEMNDGSNEYIDTKMVALTYRGSSNDYYVEMHPKYKQFEKEIILKIEKLSKEKKIDGEECRIFFYASENDKEKISVLTELGYKNRELWEYNRVWSEKTPLSESELPDGFTIRNIEGEKDYPGILEVVGAVMVHCRANMTLEKIRFFCNAPFYNQELDLVVVAPEGKFVAFSTFRIDPKTKMTELDPVGTHPDYRRMGLGKAVISEGLKRLKDYQASFIYIPRANIEEGANRLYDSLGFTEKAAVHLWVKAL